MLALVWYLAHSVVSAAPELRLAAEGPKVQDDYDDHLRSQGKPARVLACTELAPELRLCLRKVRGTALPYAHQDELQEWKLTEASALQMIKDLSQRELLEKSYVRRVIEGTELEFFSRSKKDGWDPVSLLHPQFLRSLIGGDFLVAIPEAGTFLCWKKGSAELNKIMAVGVREQYNASVHPVSPYLFEWEKGGWQVWGSAVKRSSVEPETQK